MTSLPLDSSVVVPRVFSSLPLFSRCFSLGTKVVMGRVSHLRASVFPSDGFDVNTKGSKTERGDEIRRLKYEWSHSSFLASQLLHGKSAFS